MLPRRHWIVRLVQEEAVGAVRMGFAGRVGNMWRDHEWKARGPAMAVVS